MRRPDWPEQMAAVIEGARRTSFAWGRHDCCMFMADVVAATTGNDPAAAFRHRYSTELGAKRALKRYGAGSLLATATAILGPPVAPLMARRGDVVYATTGLGPALGICGGPVAYFAAPSGLATLPLATCDHAWRID